MLGLMQDRPLLISQIIDYAGRYYPDVEIVSRTVEGPIHRYGYRDALKRSKQLAEALQGLGIKLGDRVGTIAWNTHRHFELYFGISGIGAVLHTINPRLAPDHVAYIANHAEDQAIFVDLNLLPVCSSVGYLMNQYQVHKGLVGEPIWFDWTDGHPFLHGEKFVAALELAHVRLCNTSRRGPDKDFLDYRRDEHATFLDAHHSVYAA